MGKYGVQWAGEKKQGRRGSETLRGLVSLDKGDSSQGCFNKSGLRQDGKVRGDKDRDLKSGEGQR